MRLLSGKAKDVGLLRGRIERPGREGDDGLNNAVTGDVGQHVLLGQKAVRNHNQSLAARGKILDDPLHRQGFGTAAAGRVEASKRGVVRDRLPETADTAGHVRRVRQDQVTQWLFCSRERTQVRAKKTEHLVEGILGELLKHARRMVLRDQVREVDQHIGLGQDDGSLVLFFVGSFVVADERDFRGDLAVVRFKLLLNPRHLGNRFKQEAAYPTEWVANPRVALQLGSGGHGHHRPHHISRREVLSKRFDASRLTQERFIQARLEFAFNVPKRAVLLFKGGKRYQDVPEEQRLGLVGRSHLVDENGAIDDGGLVVR